MHLEKRVFAVAGQTALHMSVRAGRFTVVRGPFLVLCFTECDLLKSPMITVELSVSPCKSVSILFIYFGAFWCMCIYNCVFGELTLYRYKMLCFISCRATDSRSVLSGLGTVVTALFGYYFHGTSFSSLSTSTDFSQ